MGVEFDADRTTVADIIESEKTFALSAHERYGTFYEHAVDASALLSLFARSIDLGYDTLVAFLAVIKKHHLLAVLSVVRLHKTQAMMNIRQVLEATTSAAFAISNPTPDHFVIVDRNGLVSAPAALAKKRYTWLEQKYPAASSSIKEMKDNINGWLSHANLISASNHFRRVDGSRQFETPFFDLEDAHFIRTDLWLCGKVAITALDLLYGANSKVGAIKFIENFTNQFDALVAQNDVLRAEIMATERYRKAQAIGHNGP